MTKTNVPRFRFKEFDGEWKEEKAKNIFVNESIKNHEHEEVLASTQNNGIVFRKDLDKDIKFDKSTLKNYKYVRPGNIVISLRSFQGGFEISDKEGIISPAYTIMSFKDDDNNTDYWKQYLKTYKFIQSLKKVTFGIRDGRSISFTEFSTLKLKFTEIKNEQEKIGSFFAKLDQLIELQTQKLEQLKKLKQGYLQKMFPQGVQAVPRFRFSGFSGEWTQKSLLESGSVYGGLTGKTKEDFGHGNSKFVPYMSVNRNFVSGDSDTELVNVLESENQHEVKKNDVLFTISSETPEEVGLSSTWLGNEETYLNSFSFGYRFSFPTDGYFTSALFRSRDVRNKIYPLAQGISRYNLSKHSFLGLKLRFPNLDEQQKIGEFLSKLDRIIGEQSNKIDKLNQQKRAYLQKMFI